MIIENATQVGNPVIRKKAVDVKNPKAKSVQAIVTNLIDSMRFHGLVGMAAPQIGKGVRIFVTEITQTKFRKNEEVDPLRVFINPRIISSSKARKSGWEGCGSVAFANLFGMVRRPTSVVVEAIDEKGNPFTLKARDLLARVIQHEVDHLNGVLFVDSADTHTYMSTDEYLKMRRKETKK